MDLTCQQMKSKPPFIDITEVIIDQNTIPKDGQFIRFTTKGNNKSRYGYFLKDSLKFVTLAGKPLSFAEIKCWTPCDTNGA